MYFGVETKHWQLPIFESIIFYKVYGIEYKKSQATSFQEATRLTHESRGIPSLSCGRFGFYIIRKIFIRLPITRQYGDIKSLYSILTITIL